MMVYVNLILNYDHWSHMTMMVYVNLILNYDHWSHDYDGICQSDFKL